MSSTGTAKVSNRTWVLALLTLVYLFNYIDRTIIYLLQESIKKEFLLADWQIGLLGGTAFGIFYSILGVPIARVAERSNRTLVITVALTVWSLMTAVCGLAQSYTQLFLARIGVAVGEAGGSPPSHSIITDYFPPHQRASALAVYVMAVPLGQMFGALLGGSIAQEAGWRMTFVIVGVPGLLLALFLKATVKEPPRGFSEPGAQLASYSAVKAPSFAGVLRHARQQKAFLHVLVGSTVAGFAGYAITGFTAAYYLRRFDLSLSSVGALYGLVFGIAAAVGVLLGGFGADALAKRDRRIYGWLPAACLFLSCPLFILAFSQTTWAVTTLALVLPCAISQVHLGSTYSVMHNSFGPRMRATATALLFLCHSLLGLSLGPLALGFASDLLAAHAFHLGDYATLCRAAGGGTTPELKAGCRVASATGLREAMMLITVFFLWGAVHFALAARRLKKTWDDPVELEPVAA